jgi:hypothetical protein
MFAVRGVVASRHTAVNSTAKEARQRGDFILINFQSRRSKKMLKAMLDGDTDSAVAGWCLDVSEGRLEYHYSADGCQTEVRAAER